MRAAAAAVVAALLPPLASSSAPSPGWQSFTYGASGLCLSSPETFPCPGGAMNSCPVFLGPCASPTANWTTAVEAGRLVSGFECPGGGCGLNVDCDAVVPGAVVKLAAGMPRAAIAFNASAGQLVYVSRGGVTLCLASGLAAAPTPPCFAGEQFLPNQITVADCGDAATAGWRAVAPGAGGAGAGAPCDVYAAAGTPCVAAHSLTRALFGAYGGRLYTVQRASDNKTADVSVVAPGGAADAAAQDAFCGAPPPPPVPPAGAVVRLVPAASPRLALRHCESVAYVNPLSGDNDFAFVLVPALNGEAYPGAVSLQSVNYPQRYLAPAAAAVPGAEPGRVGIVAAPPPAGASWAVAAAPGGGWLLTSRGGGGALAVGANLTGACAREYRPPSAGVFLSPAATAWRLDDGGAGGACTVTAIYDQSPRGNHLAVAPPGTQAPHGNSPVRAADFPLAIGGGGARVYGALFLTGMGYRRDNTSGMAIGDAAETILMVTSNAAYDAGCCFDYGSAEIDNKDHGPGTMEAVYFGNVNATAAGWCGGAYDGQHNGPFVMADLESGIWACATPRAQAPLGAAQDFSVVSAMVKGDGGRRWALHAGDATGGGGGPLASLWDGPRPPGYNPMKLQGAIILGIGGDSSHGSVGVFLEGLIVANFTSGGADAAVHANIVAAGYNVSAGAGPPHQSRL